MSPSRFLRSTSASFALCALAAGLLTSCDSNSSSSAPFGHGAGLKVTAITVLTTDLQVAHDISLETTIQTLREVRNVAVCYVLYRQDDIDGAVESVESHEIGTHAFPVVSPETFAYRAHFTIPDNVPAGDYYLGAELLGLPDEDENNFRARLKNVPVTVSAQQSKVPDIVLESLEFDADAVVLEQEEPPLDTTVADHPNHHLGATVGVRITGLHDIPGLQIAASIIELDLPPPLKTEEVLRIWDTAKNQYVEHVQVDVKRGEQVSIHLDLMVPEPLRKAIVSQLINLGGTKRFKFQVHVDPLDAHAEHEGGSARTPGRQNDNLLTAELILVPPPLPPSGTILFQEDFVKQWENSRFGVGLEFHAIGTFDKRGAIARTEAKVPVTVFGRTHEILAFDAHGQVTPQDTTQSNFGLDLDVLGQTVFTHTIHDPQFKWTKPWSINKSAEQSATFLVGPVPVNVGGGVSGTLGFEITLEGDTGKLELTAVPTAKVEAFATAAVGGSFEIAGVRVVAARAGVEGKLALVADSFTAQARFSDLSYDETNKFIQGTLGFDVANALTGPSGEIDLFAEATLNLVITSIGKKWTLPIVTWSTFSKTDLLFSKQQTVKVDV